jgi:hypothetical protein
MKKNWSACLIFIVLCVTSCMPKPSAVVDDASCEAPCWRNISMGMGETETISLLNKMMDVDKNTIDIKSTSNPFWEEAVHWQFSRNEGLQQGIYFHDSKVVMMYFEVKGIRLSSAIKKYGEPIQVWATKMILDTTAVNITFMYPNKGICFENIPSWPILNLHGNSYLVDKSLYIEEIFYFDPSIGVEKYDIGCIWAINKSLIQPWKGYGNYEIYQN